MQGLRWLRLEQVEHRTDPAQGRALRQPVESDRWKMAVACPPAHPRVHCDDGDK